MISIGLMYNHFDKIDNDIKKVQVYEKYKPEIKE